MVLLHWSPTLFVTLLVLIVSVQSCVDLYPRQCPKWAKKGFCDFPKYTKTLQVHCKKSCDFCSESTCMDLIDRRVCENYQGYGLCEEGHVKDVCGYTCGTCKTMCPEIYLRNGMISGDTGGEDNTRGRKDIAGPLKKGEVVKVDCKDGFQHMSGSPYLECQADGSYNASAGACISKTECVVPTKRDGYILVSDSLDSYIKRTVAPGTYAVLVCKNGNRAQSFCSSYGTWVPRIRRCDDDKVDWKIWKDHDAYWDSERSRSILIDFSEGENANKRENGENEERVRDFLDE